MLQLFSIDNGMFFGTNAFDDIYSFVSLCSFGKFTCHSCPALMRPLPPESNISPQQINSESLSQHKDTFYLWIDRLMPLALVSFPSNLPCVCVSFFQYIPNENERKADSVCSNGFPGVQDEAACCAENCGQCGGAGCGTLNGTGGTDFCCSSSIIANGTSCSVTLEAPCFIEDWVPTPSPTELITAAPVGELFSAHGSLRCAKTKYKSMFIGK